MGFSFYVSTKGESSRYDKKRHCLIQRQREKIELQLRWTKLFVIPPLLHKMYFHSASVASQLDFNSESADLANNGNYSLSSWLGGGFREKPMLNLGKKNRKKHIHLMFHCNLQKRIVTLVRINWDR